MTDSGSIDEKWETLCRGCGECCFEKIEDDNGTIFYLMTACRYLDLETRQCRIYENRFIINPGCVKLTPELVPTLRWLPRDCGYRAAPPPDAPPMPRRGRSRRGKNR
jgi:uncharacterized cysteine cluster protein YcgN (CxxCxxCC family)